MHNLCTKSGVQSLDFQPVKHPIVSIVMAEYNCMPYLPDAIKSVLNQTYPHFELIVVDDHSDDGSYSYAEQQQRLDSRIRLLTNKEKGAGSARNYGISCANGDYLLFLDGDDVFYPTMLESLIKTASSTEAEITLCNYHINGEGFNQDTPALKYLKAGAFLFNCFHSGVLLDKVNKSAWNKLYEKKFVLKNGLVFQNCRHANDVYFVMTAFLRSSHIAVVDSPLMLYFLRKNGTQGKKQKDPLEIMVPIKALLVDAANYEHLWQRTAALHLALSLFCFDYASFANPVTKKKLSEVMADCLRNSSSLSNVPLRNSDKKLFHQLCE